MIDRAVNGTARRSGRRKTLAIEIPTLRDEFASFYQDGFHSVYAAVYGYAGSRDWAVEATQEAFSRAWARWRRLRKHGWAIAWVTTTAINVLRRRHKQDRREAADPTTAGRGWNEEPSTARPDVLAALRHLPPRQRESIVLHYILDCPVAVVAELMGVAEGTVKAHLAAARRSLSLTLFDYASHARSERKRSDD